MHVNRGPERFILWELPLARFHQYELCIWAENGVRAWWPESGTQTRERFEALAAEWRGGVDTRGS